MTIPSNWTDEEIAVIKGGATWQEFQVLLPTSEKTYYAYKNKKARMRVDNPNVTAERSYVTDTRPEAGVGVMYEEPDFEALFQRLETNDDLAEATDLHTKTVVAYREEDTLPVGVVFTGDWHVGAAGTRHGILSRLCRELPARDGVFLVGMGDYVEGASVHGKNSSALYSSVLDGEAQDRLVERYINYGRDRWLALCAGNHDLHAYKHAGVNRMARLADRLGLPLIGEGGGCLQVTVGSCVYRILVRHDAGGSSATNPSGGGRRLAALWPSHERADATVLGHRHFNDLHIESGRGGRRIVHARSGTFKLQDPHAESLGLTPELGCPLFILYPDRKEIVAWRGDDLDRGIAYLSAERERYANAS
jgi:hypothetical protein